MPNTILKNPATLRTPLSRRQRSVFRRPLRFVTFLAPNLLPLYEFISRYVGERLNWPISLSTGISYQTLDHQADVSFLCGLPYVLLTRQRESLLEPLAAPVLQGDRYGGRPLYYSDVIVRSVTAHERMTH
jgi:phosphonate transport system substrate-binding protein